MKREIKFRGKTVVDPSWEIGSLVQGESLDFILVDGEKDREPNDNHSGTKFHTFQVIRETIGQYTGMKDKNGKEIYEGDIVLQIGYNGKKVPMVVRFECGAFIVGYHKGSSTRMTPMLISKQCEVIGNIHDNLELINHEL